MTKLKNGYAHNYCAMDNIFENNEPFTKRGFTATVFLMLNNTTLHPLK